MCVCFACVCLVPRPEDLEEEAIQQQPKAAGYESVSETFQAPPTTAEAEPDKQAIPLPYKDDPVAVEISEEDAHEISSS